MRNLKWFLPALFLLVFFVTPLSAFAATTNPKGAALQPPRTVSSSPLQSVKLRPGQQVDIPQKDGTTRHIKLSLSSGKSKSSNLAATPLVALSSGCTNASESEWGTNIFGGTLYKYTVSQYWCWNSSAITYLPGQNVGWQTCCGWGLNSQSSYNSWISYPWSAYAHGNFIFYGPLGTTVVNGWVEIYVYGDGSYWGQAG